MRRRMMMEGDAKMEKEWIYAGQQTFTYGSETENNTIGRVPLTPSVPDDYDATEVVFVVDDFRSTTAAINSTGLRWNNNASIQVGSGFDSAVGSGWFGKKYYYFKKLIDGIGMWIKQGTEQSLLELGTASPKCLSSHWIEGVAAGNILTVIGRTYYR